MSESNKTYTYRAGQKIELEKSTDQMVVRNLAENLDDAAIVSSEQVSSASTRINVSDAELESAMDRSRSAAPTHHAYYEPESGNEFLITDRILVTFHQALSDSEVDEFAGKYGLLNRATYNDKDYLFQLTDHTGVNPVKLVVQLMENEPLVENAEHDLNQRMSKYQFTGPLDPEYTRQWHLHTALTHPDYDLRSCSQCEDSWRLTDSFGNSEVVVAVTDDGCKLDHVDFDSPNKFAAWGYFRGSRLVTAADIDADPDQMYKPGSNHGTSCCGVISAEIDAMRTVGAAAACQVLPVQWESSGASLFLSDSKLLSALAYISDKADVMSNSWGNSPTSMWTLQVINRISQLSQTGGRRGKGIVFLWAAGNENCPISHTGTQDIPFSNGFVSQGGASRWVGVDTAKRFRHNLTTIPGVMHIAALASTAMRSHYSNYGPDISLCAPSSNSHSYRPRGTVRGLGITTTTGNSGGVTHGFGGTSSATPLVAGIAALTISANPNLRAAEVVSILKQTASKDLDFSGYPRTPPASYNPDTSWDVSPIAPFDDGQFVNNGSSDGSWSPWFGHGRVDAFAAVAEAQSRISPATSQQFAGNSAPDRSIPDNRISGIKDVISCNQSFVLSSVKISVDIAHTYVGDLTVSLISPAGTAVILHNRNGGSQNDLHAQYDVSSAPGLHALAGEEVNGDWALHVQDLASADRGRLMRWSLDLTEQAQSLTVVEESPGVIIPDNSPVGIERSLSVADSGQLDTVEVELDITHTYIGDLIIELVSPDDTAVRLHSQSGGSGDNIIKTFTLLNTNALQNLRGESITGDWRLRISDRASVDQGKLNRWALRLGTV